MRWNITENPQPALILESFQIRLCNRSESLDRCLREPNKQTWCIRSQIDVGSREIRQIWITIMSSWHNSWSNPHWTLNRVIEKQLNEWMDFISISLYDGSIGEVKVGRKTSSIDIWKRFPQRINSTSVNVTKEGGKENPQSFNNKGLDMSDTPKQFSQQKENLINLDYFRTFSFAPQKWA